LGSAKRQFVKYLSAGAERLTQEKFSRKMEGDPFSQGYGFGQEAER
jgi:hypothetical protein